MMQNTRKISKTLAHEEKVIEGPVFGNVDKWKGLSVIFRALTNTVSGEYECIHDYRVTNTNASIRRMPADSPLFGKNERSNHPKTRAPFYLIRTGTVPKLNRYQPV